VGLHSAVAVGGRVELKVGCSVDLGVGVVVVRAVAAAAFEDVEVAVAMSTSLDVGVVRGAHAAPNHTNRDKIRNHAFMVK
jgi:hypothetical protein